MTDTKHTATPYYTDENNIRCNDGIIANVYDPNDTTHRTKASTANTEFIVRAVNNHCGLMDIVGRFIIDAKLTGVSSEAGWDALFIDAEKVFFNVYEDQS